MTTTLSAFPTSRGAPGENGAVARLLALSQSGDIAATHELIARYHNLVGALAWRLTPNSHDAHDLASDTYVRLFAVLNTCRDINTLPAWITRITVNLFNKGYKKNKQRREISLGGLLESGDTGYTSSEEDPARQILGQFEATERRERMMEAVTSLSPMYRAILDQFYTEGRSYEEIASAAHIPINTVKSRLFRAREALRRKLADLINF